MAERFGKQMVAELQRAEKIAAVVKRVGDGQPDTARLMLPLGDVRALLRIAAAVDALERLGSIGDRLRDFAQRGTPDA